MAITPKAELANIAKVDLTEKVVIRRVRVPDSFTFSRPDGELVYDRPSDIMLVLFHGRDKGSFTVNVVDDYSVLLDIDTEEMIGIQIDDFLFSAVKDQPSLITLLDYADLQGMTVTDVRHERHRVLGYWGRFKLWIEQMIETLARRGGPHRQNAVEALLNRGRLGSTISYALGSA